MKWIFCLVCSLLAGGANLRAAAVELLNNPGLESPYVAVSGANENGIVSGRLPTGWSDGSLFTSGTHTDTVFAEETAGTIRGSALRATAAIQKGFSSGADFQIFQTFRAVRGRAYTAKVWMKAAANVTVRFWVFQNAAPYAARASINCAVTGNWQEFSFTFTPTVSEMVRLDLHSFNQTPTSVWIDEFSLTVSDGGREWVVSPAGSDVNPGTSAAPLRSLAAALASALPGESVLLRGGTYRETLLPVASGTANAPITVAAYSGEAVTISACDAVVGPWTPTTAGIYSANVGWDLGPGYNQIFVDGVLQDEARHPNRVSSDPLNPATMDVTVSNAHTITSPALSGFGDLSGARFLGGVGQAWAWQTAVVASNGGATITVDPATESSWWWPNFEGKTSTAGRGFIYGKLALLDSDGEWYLQSNPTAPHVLSVRIASKGDPATHLVEMKRRNWCIDADNINYFSVRGITLRGGAVRLNGIGNTLEDCDARYLSHFLTFQSGASPNGGRYEGSGIFVDGTNAKVSGCKIYDTAGSGIFVAGRGHVITRNHIYNTDYSGTYASGLYVVGEGHRVAFNTVHDSGRDIMNPNGAGLLVWYNDLYNPGRLAKDAGVIYSWGVNGMDSGGNKNRIAYNWVHDGNPDDPLSNGIYLDNYDRNFRLDHNVVWNFGASFKNLGIVVSSPGNGQEFAHNTQFNCASYVNRTYTSFPRNNPSPSFWTTANHGLSYTDFNSLVITDPEAVLENWTQRDFRPKAGALAINPPASTSTTRWTTPDGSAGVPADFVLNMANPPQPFSYERQFGQGVRLPGINDDFLGATPDGGAYERGGAYWKPGIDGWAVESPMVQSLPPSMTGSTSATLSAMLLSAGLSDSTVQVFWGTADGGTNSSAWQNTMTLGTYRGSFVPVEQPVANLTSNLSYRYRFRVVNASGEAWSTVQTAVTVNTPPAVTRQPASQTVTAGGSVTFSVVASGTAPFTYQWTKNGVAIPGATNASYTINAVSKTDASSYAVVVTNPAGSVTSVATTLTVNPSVWLSNVSARTTLASGQTLIVSFVVSGGQRDVLLRAAGPALVPFGLTSAMVDPKIEVYKDGTKLTENNDWLPALADTFGRLGAFAFSAGSKDAAILQNVGGSNSALITGTGSGTVLVEGYDAGTGTAVRLVNLSARNWVGIGNDILIAGFNVAGTGSIRVLVRAIGPRLADFGVTGALIDPTLELYDGSTKLSENDNWDSSLLDTFASVGAFSLNAASKDSALIATLAAGKTYTVQVSGVGQTTGEALIEIYELP